MPRALIAMSGGVDSSVSAYLMQQAGYDCVGAMLQLFPKDGTDAQDAQRVAKRLGLPFYLLDYQAQFRENVMEYFACAYERGETPNPCVACNRTLKFGALYEKAAELGCDCLVTGHYARIVEENGRFLLKKAVEAARDQSYVLYMLTQAQLRRVRFPLGEMTKAQAREIAAQQGFSNAKKHDSQDICFVPDGDYASVITALHGCRTPAGDFVDACGNVLGRHKGLIHYTLGQRRGLGISSEGRLYVTALEPEENRVVLGANADLFTRELTAADFFWSAFDTPPETLRAKAKVRYRHTEQWASVTALPDGKVRVVFDEPQRAITRGQAVVLYDGDTVLGGGTIL